MENIVKKRNKVLVALAFIVIAILYVLVNSVNISPLYAEGAFFWAMIVTILSGLWVIGNFWEFISVRLKSKEAQNLSYVFAGLVIPKKIKFIIAVPWVYIVVMMIISTPIVSAGTYKDQLGTPEKRTFSSDIQVVDTNKLPIVDANLAAKLANKKLGEKPSLGSQVHLGEPTLQQVNGELTWVLPLHHSGFFKWVTNMSGTPGYVTVSATDVNDVEYVDDYNIKYHPNSFLLDDLLRHVRLNGGLFDGVTDYSFELDDTGKPYWVITTYENKRGFGLPEATGALIVDAQTGDIQRTTIETAPEWVDRIQPENFIMNQIDNQGEYVHGILNFANKDKFMASQGQTIVYNDGDCFLLTCITSVGVDESAIGFMMVDMVTKETFLYEMAGATEVSAQRSAQGKVENFGYKASTPIIINVDGQPTYFMTLKDKEGLIKQYAFVSVVNYSTVGTGETIDQAMNDYQKALRNDSSVDIGLGSDIINKSGKVLRIASEFNGSATTYKIILENDSNKIYLVDSNISDQLALTLAGDNIEVSFYETESNSIVCSSFENKSI